MDLFKKLYLIDFPADFLRDLILVRLRENSSSWPVISTGQGIYETSKNELFDASLITALETRLGLKFEMEDMRYGKICFANTEDVIPEFRTSFSGGELLSYIYAFLPSSDSSKGPIYLPFPEGPDDFWRLVQVGQKKRK